MIENVKKERCKWTKQKILDNTNLTDKDAEEIASKIFLATLQECSKPIKKAELEGLYKQKILDWCAKQKQ